MPRLGEYVRIAEAAKHLGVCRNILRNWGRTGKISAATLKKEQPKPPRYVSTMVLIPMSRSRSNTDVLANALSSSRCSGGIGPTAIGSSGETSATDLHNRSFAATCWDRRQCVVWRRCPKCRELSPSEQAVVIENRRTIFTGWLSCTRSSFLAMASTTTARAGRRRRSRWPRAC